MLVPESLTWCAETRTRMIPKLWGHVQQECLPRRQGDYVVLELEAVVLYFELEAARRFRDGLTQLLEAEI